MAKTITQLKKELEDSERKRKKALETLKTREGLKSKKIAEIRKLQKLKSKIRQAKKRPVTKATVRRRKKRVSNIKSHVRKAGVVTKRAGRAAGKTIGPSAKKFAKGARRFADNLAAQEGGF